RPDRPGDRRGRGLCRDRAARADPAAGFSGRRVHDPDRRRRGVHLRGRQPHRRSTAVTATATSHRADPLADAHVTFPRVLRSEWIKFTSLRSTIWTIAVTLVVMVGFSALMAWGMSFAAEAPDGQGPPAADGSTMGAVAVVTSYGLAQIVMAVWGVLVISGEYSTGQIRSTLTAVPTRLPVLAAKGLLVALASFVVGAVGVALSVLVTAPILSPNDMSLDLGD